MPLARRALLILALALAGVVPALAADGQTLVVGDGGYATIDAALAEAGDGAVIEVRGGVHDAPVVVNRPVTLVGTDGAVIDGRGEGSLVLIEAPGVVLRGFTLRDTGTNMSHEDTAVVVQADGVTVEDNVLEDVLFGIYFAEADGGIARRNVIGGKTDLDVAMRGDAIRVYYSNGVTLEANTVRESRDVLIWYANDIRILDNHFVDDRYGLHFMYSARAIITGNTIESNHVGAYLMFSEGLTLENNNLVNNRGPSGYGIALKDMDNAIVRDNVIAGNRVGLYLDNSPQRYDVYNHFNGNLIAYNDLGVTGLPAVSRNIFSGNSFLDNTQQASVQGRGTLQGNLWSDDGTGNYWSDYAGYDQAGDGTGDRPYRSEKLFDSLVDTYPALRLFVYSPAAQALDFAAAAFPSLRPDPRLVDDAPQTTLVLPGRLASAEAPLPLPLLAAALALVGLGAGLLVAACGLPRLPRFAAPLLPRRKDFLA